MDKYISPGVAFATFLSMAFSAIVLFFAFAVFDLTTRNGWLVGLFFMLINLGIIVASTALYKLFRALTSFAAYIQAWFITGVYSFIHFILFFIALGRFSSSMYVFVNMLLFLFYLTVVFAITMVAKKLK
ncbi:MAG: hypothetical protein FWF77_10190 [Defluviitaleaceae bacterium]|nr:hypothetical protein [Defluviitaleaceae bacterium]